LEEKKLSIYAGPMWSIKVPTGNCYPPSGWVEVFATSVPSHIGYSDPTDPDGDQYPDGDPYGDFLPPPCTEEEYEEGEIPRAIVFVRADKRKKEGQQYVDAIATIPGRDYEKMTFVEVMQLIYEGLE
jgi:hypothetical protein